MSPRMSPAQAYKAPQEAGYAGQLVVARMDVPRFRKVNTAKGPWRLLDALATTPRATGLVSDINPDAAGTPPGGGAVTVLQLPAAQLDGGATAGSRMRLEDVRRAVRDVASDIVGEEALEGDPDSTVTTEPLGAMFLLAMQTPAHPGRSCICRRTMQTTCITP
jgi:hypothetical protein